LRLALSIFRLKLFGLLLPLRCPFLRLLSLRKMPLARFFVGHGNVASRFLLVSNWAHGLTFSFSCAAVGCV
jgi:hypothetical protein